MWLFSFFFSAFVPFFASSVSRLVDRWQSLNPNKIICRVLNSIFMSVKDWTLIYHIHRTPQFVISIEPFFSVDFFLFVVAVAVVRRYTLPNIRCLTFVHFTCLISSELWIAFAEVLNIYIFLFCCDAHTSHTIHRWQNTDWQISLSFAAHRTLGQLNFFIYNCLHMWVFCSSSFSSVQWTTWRNRCVCLCLCVRK